jgi:aminoglycoside/choline kinase family phosphotransferase
MKDKVAAFLDKAGWGGARVTPMRADFSPRRYARLERGDGRHAILMQADADQKTPQFVALSGLLRGMEISAPEIYAASPDQGLVLMEDFGSRNVGALLDAGAEPLPLYRRATEVLARLHQCEEPKSPLQRDELQLPLFNAALFVEQAELFLDEYIPFALNRVATAGEREDFRAAWLEALKPVEALPQTLMLRDFMPDNLMDLPERAGWRSVGVLDFQDAGIGPVAYDLASLCEAVRRDGGPERLDEVLTHYHRLNPAIEPETLRRACHILAAQRHTRILGLIARKPEKQAFLPHVQGYLGSLLKDKAFEAMPFRGV